MCYAKIHALNFFLLFQTQSQFKWLLISSVDKEDSEMSERVCFKWPEYNILKHKWKWDILFEDLVARKLSVKLVGQWRGFDAEG